MIKKTSRKKIRNKRHYRLRRHISGTANKPRLCVFRSNNHIYAQIIDDVKGVTLVAASTMEKAISGSLEKTNNVDAAKAVGSVLGKKAVEQGISEIVFDRGGYIYHGKIAALADSAREAGLQF